MFILLTRIDEQNPSKILIKIENILHAYRKINEEFTELFYKGDYLPNKITVLETVENIKNKIKKELEFHGTIKNPMS